MTPATTLVAAQRESISSVGRNIPRTAEVKLQLLASLLPMFEHMPISPRRNKRL